MAKKNKKKTTPISHMTKEEQIELVDKLIDRDAEVWKQYIRYQPTGLEEFLSRRNDIIILRPTQR